MAVCLRIHIIFDERYTEERIGIADDLSLFSGFLDFS